MGYRLRGKNNWPFDDIEPKGPDLLNDAKRKNVERAIRKIKYPIQQYIEYYIKYIDGIGNTNKSPTDYRKSVDLLIEKTCHTVKNILKGQ